MTRSLSTPKLETAIVQSGRVQTSILILWAAALAVSLGLVGSVPIGFYQFRLSDLLFFCSVILLIRSGLQDLALKIVLLVLILWVTFRASSEWQAALSIGAERTLLGMAATMATPLIFVAIRSTRFDLGLGWKLLGISWLVALMSQFHVLPYGEGAASGTLDIGFFFGLDRLPEFISSYQENTVAVWRAISAGSAIAAVVLPLPMHVKALGIVACILQFAGGGGGRSLAFFLALAPAVVVLARPRRNANPAGVLMTAVGAGAILATAYTFNPIAALIPVKGNYEVSHTERVLQTLRLVQANREIAIDAGGLEGRVQGYDYYWSQISSDANIFWNGVGLYRGAAFEISVDNPNGSAHNALLDIWALGGVLGVGFFLFFVGVVISDLRWLITTTGRSWRGDLVALSFALGWLYVLQFVLFQAAAVDRSLMAVFYLLGGSIRPIAIALQDPGVREGFQPSRQEFRAGAAAWRHGTATASESVVV